MLRRPPVADHQARQAARAWAGPVPPHALDGQAVLGGAGDDVMLDVRSGKLKDRVQPGGDLADVPAPAVQGGGQAVPAAPVGQPGPPDLPVVAA